MHIAREKNEEFSLIKSKSFSFKVSPKKRFFSGIDKEEFYCARVKKREREKRNLS